MKEKENMTYWVDLVEATQTFVADDELDNKLRDYLSDKEMQDLYDTIEIHQAWVTTVKLYDTSIQIYFNDGSFCGWLL